MDKFEALIKYFPSGVAAGERVILEKVFVRDSDFAEIMTPSPGNARLLVGKKGAGKSAFLDIAGVLLAQSNVPVVTITPSDLDFNDAADFSSIAAVTREFVRALVRTVGVALGKDASGLIGGSDKVLHSMALDAGDKFQDAVGRLAAVVASVDYNGISFNPAALLGSGRFSLQVQLDAVRANIDQTHGAFFLLIDDIDHVSALGGGLDVERIYACLLGIKKLAADIPKLRIIVTLRDEVWRALGRARSDKIDQLDHFSLVVRALSPSKDQIKGIVRKRLEAAAAEVGVRGRFNEYEPFFEGAVGKMPSSEQSSSWDDLIVSRCRERPRDAVQLINLLATKRVGSARLINDDVLASVMPVFSQQRIELLRQEYSTICPQIEALVESLRFMKFAAGSFTAITTDVKGFIEGCLGRFGVQINGIRMSRESVDHIFEIWRLLFDVGVLNARVADDREGDGYRHISPKDEPDFVSIANWNEMQAVTWEVHPAYRDRLHFLLKEDKARTGLAIKPQPWRRGRQKG